MRQILYFLLVISTSILAQDQGARNCGFVASKLNFDRNAQIEITNVVTIPVHVIVVHKDNEQIGQGRNLTDAQILSQFSVLNQDFRRLNPDTNNTPSEFLPVAADCMIEFCLADTDPNGNPTNGITRYVYNSNNVTENYLDQTIKPATIWNPDYYLNIWTARISDDGYAYMPSDGVPSYMDGVVVRDTYFGFGGSAQLPFERGHMATHEIGHYLGLFHTWGPFSGCTIGDGISDTPDQQNYYYDCPSYPQNSCGSSDMFMNYMDYVDDACLNLFTEGQKIAMHNTIQNGRPGLLQSYGCSSVDPISLTEINIKENKKLIKSINVFGKEISKHTKNQILFYIYNDGSVEKMFFN